MSTATVRSLDSRIDDLEKEFLTFQARMEMIISLQKWVGGFVLATLVAVIVQTFSISFAAGRLQEKVDNQVTALYEVKSEIRRLQEKVDAQGSVVQDIKTDVRKTQEKLESQGSLIQDIKTDLRKTQEKLEAQGALIQEIRTELREFRKDLIMIRDELQKRKS